MYNISPTKESRCPHPLFRYHIHVRETDGVIQDGQSRETGNIGYTRRRQSKQKNTTQHMLNTTMRKQTQIT
jgi:predicted acetyltransferase